MHRTKSNRFDGVESCTKATTISISSNFYGDGAYSAYNATNLKSGDSLYCGGEISCADINFLQIKL